MKKKYYFIGGCVLILILILGILFLLGNKQTRTDSLIVLEKSIWLDTQKKYKIHSTKDTMEVLTDVTFDNSSEELSDWSQTVDYRITVDGKAYNGSFSFSSDSDKIDQTNDKNPIYDIKIDDYKSHEVKVTITKKNK